MNYVDIRVAENHIKGVEGFESHHLFWKGENMRVVTQVAFWLVIIGALNWGLVGLLDVNLVSALFGAMGVISRIVYILVGISAIWLIVDLFRSHTLTEVRK